MLVVDGREDRRVEELDSQLDQVVLDEIPQVQHVEAGMGEEGVNGRGDVWRPDAGGIRNATRALVWADKERDKERRAYFRMGGGRCSIRCGTHVWALLEAP